MRPSRSGQASPRNASAPRPAQPTLPPLPLDSLAMALTVAGDAVGYVRNGHALNDGLTALWRHYPDLPAATRGAAQDMIYGTLRDYGRGEFMLSRLLQQPLSDPTIDGLLRVALHRLEVRADTAHTVVDQTVEAAARIARGGLKGLVNGVLRNALRQWNELVAACDRNEEASLRHPQWWIDRVRRAAPETWREQLAAANTHPPMSLRINRRRTSMAAALQMLEAAGHEVRQLGEYALHVAKPVPVASLPGFTEGLLSVQDWGAQQAAALLDLADGQRVLDACAAPGGKTAHMLELADVQITALDSDATRASRVEAQLARLGLSAQIKTADCRQTASWWDGRPFDRILADVPCSASGVARRHPDIKWLRTAADVARFATQQAEILDALWPTLAVGGKMLYVTCSIFAEENSLQVSRFAARHADCRRLAFADGVPESHWLPGPENDGFYFALLEKLA